MKTCKYHYSVLLFSVITAAFLTGCTSGTGKAPPRLGKAPVKKVIAAMTLEEKAKLVVGTGFFFEVPDSILALSPEGEGPFLRRRQEPEVDSAYAAMLKKIRQYVPGAAGRTAEIARLGITTMVLADGPAGLRISPTRRDDPGRYYCTAFPIATLLASTWDTELVHRVGEAMGDEVLEYGADIILGPGMNLHRNPLCGRNFEYFSEDPLVTGEMGAAIVKGIQSKGVGTSLKHFAANNQETNRNTVNTIVSERALREIYLEGFRIAVKEAQPWTVMSSYNKINGVYTSESHDLLTKILRDDWGFKGYVMTDWGGGSDVIAQMQAGNDLLMPGQPRQYGEIIAAVEEGRLEMELLDRNVERILTVLMETPGFKAYGYSDSPDLAGHSEVARQAGADGMVLLKNDQEALPLGQNIQTLAAFGNTSYEIITGGTGSGDVNEAYSISLFDGLKNAGYTMDESLMTVYTDYIREARAKQPRQRFFFLGSPPIPEMEVKSSLISKMAEKADAALVTIGRNSGEGGDRKAEAGDFYLTDVEKSLIRNVVHEFRTKGKKTVVILNISGVIGVAGWRELPDAILLAWQPGQETGNAIADVISGKVNPSGKLACTFPNSYDDVPSARNFPGIELPDTAARENQEGAPFSPFGRSVPAEVVYEEDIYVGYRYYNTFDIPVAYEFGFGLSYTRFEYSNIQADPEKFRDRVTFTVDVKNTGATAGREVVQVYLGAPAVKLDKPSEELVAFAKTRLLDPGESQTLTFEILASDLASFDETSSAWIAEAGKYEVKIGASSRDIRQTATFDLDREMVIKKVSKALEPDRKINRIQP